MAHGPTDATALAAQAAARGDDCVVAVGGDGTLHRVLNGVAGTTTALALVPAGTANVWAREAGIPADPVLALRLVAEGARPRLDTGSVGESSFLLMASAGLDSLVAGQVGGAIKRHIGSFAYLGRAAIELWNYRGLSAEIEIDGERLRGPILAFLAGNTRSYGGLIEIAREARADDGLLDVCLFQGRGRRRFVRHLTNTARGRHLLDAAVVHRRARQVTLTIEERWPVQADGEVVGQTPVTIRCMPRSVTVVVPAGRRSPLWEATEEAR